MERSIRSHIWALLALFVPSTWLVFYLDLPWYAHLINLGFLSLAWVFWTSVFDRLSEKKGEKTARKTLLIFAAVAAGVLITGVLLLILLPQ